MKISVLNIGNELLKGSTANTNLVYMGHELLKLGMPPIIQMSVNDEPQEMRDAISYLENKSDVIISTGGLGPTTDDITVQVFAEHYGLKVYCDENVVMHIQNIIGYDKALSVHNRKQAIVPENSKILENRNGTAPGILFEAKEKTIFLLPGPPAELIPLFNENVLPAIKAKLKEPIFFKSLYTVGIAESELQRMVSEKIPINEKLYVAYRAEPGGCELTFSSARNELVQTAVTIMYSVIGKSILDYESKNIAEEIVKRLIELNLTLSSAESCTGGMLASRITDISGASKIFKGGIVAYSNEVKSSCLKVDEEILNSHGAVSSQCAVDMAEGCAKLFDTDIAISITGIAGPDGGTPTKPVGTVFIALKFKDKTIGKDYKIKGDRNRVRTRSCAFALNMLRDAIMCD